VQCSTRCLLLNLAVQQIISAKNHLCLKKLNGSEFTLVAVLFLGLFQLMIRVSQIEIWNQGMVKFEILVYICRLILNMKILDKFLIRAFIGPFIIATFIALFVLIMQFLWLYIDELMGKGLTIFDVTELLFYLSVAFVPNALPIGVLIATVMVMGNLAERYELSSFKSAGVSLLRVMRPLLMSVGTIAIFSFFTSEVLIPWANLKFYSRLYDIRKSKPALNLEAGVFNDEFAAFTLRIGKKHGDGSQLENVMIYGNKSFNNSLVNQTLAKRGEMLNSADRQFIVMNLYDGIRYEETTGSNGQHSGKNPFVRTKFSSWQTIFDLSEFDRKKTDEDLFKNNQKMLSSSQLWRAIDSMNRLDRTANDDMLRNVRELMTPLKKPNVTTLPPSSGGATMTTLETAPHLLNHNLAGKVDAQKTVATDSIALAKIKKGEKKIFSTSEKIKQQLDSISKLTLAGTPLANSTNPASVKKDSLRNKALGENFYDVIPNTLQGERYSLEQRSENSARNVQSSIENTIRQNKQNDEQNSKFLYELHMKYTAALICLVFLFIGAPMGAIIQKGGFGYPILVAIGFYVLYIIGTIYCKNMRDSGGLAATPAAWVPVFFMVPIALLLTWRAVNDYKMSLDGTGKKIKTMYQNLKAKWDNRKAKTA
jgi:lipopolysaccharide export system permease protein